MKNLLETLAQASREAEIIAVMNEWDNYDAEDAWSGNRKALEQRLMAVFAGKEPNLTGTLYRGQGVIDDDFELLADGGQVTVHPTKNLLTSWSWSKEVADHFAKNALEAGFSSVVISMDASKLSVIVDVSSLPFLEGTMPYNEQEVIVLSEPLVLSEANLIKAYKYEGDYQ